MSGVTSARWLTPAQAGAGGRSADVVMSGAPECERSCRDLGGSAQESQGLRAIPDAVRSTTSGVGNRSVLRTRPPAAGRSAAALVGMADGAVRVGVVPVGEQCAQRGEQDQGLVEHRVVAG